MFTLRLAYCGKNIFESNTDRSSAVKYAFMPFDLVISLLGIHPWKAI